MSFDGETSRRRLSTTQYGSLSQQATPTCKTKVTKTKNLIIFRVQEFFSSDTDAAAGAAATAAATAAASAAAFVFTTVFTVVATVAAAEAAAVAAAVAAAPAAASVSEEKNSWTLNIIRFLVFVTLVLHVGVACCDKLPYCVVESLRLEVSPSKDTRGARLRHASYAR